MRNLIKDANSEQLLELIEKCKGKGKIAVPVAIIIMGFDTQETDKILEQIADAENMKIVDYSAIAKSMNYQNPEKIEGEWKRQINESMMGYRGVIIERNFGDNVLTRANMVTAARTGMKYAKVILLKLSTDSVKGFMYHRKKYGEEYSSTGKQVIAENIARGQLDLSERIDYVVELSL